jgi:hypothetical protein
MGGYGSPMRRPRLPERGARRGRRWSASRGVFGAFVLGMFVLGVGLIAAPASSHTGGFDLAAVDVAVVSSGRPATRLVPPLRSFTVIGTGDILTENKVVNRAAADGVVVGRRYDFVPMFAPVAEVVSSVDLAICHAEIPIGLPGERAGLYGRSPFGGNLLLAPFELAEGLAATGFDRCSTASNHSYDLGVPGIDRTLDVFDMVGLSHVGTARTPDEFAAAPEPFLVNGVRVAHLSVTTYSNTVPPREPWRMTYTNDPRVIAGQIAAARAAGAEVVIVSWHTITELVHEPSAADRVFIAGVVAAGADAVIGHGPHVVSPLEWIGDVPVFWSTGNFVSGMGEPGRGKFGRAAANDGVLAEMRFTETSTGAWAVDAGLIAICNEPVVRTVHLATETWRPGAAACMARTEAVVGPTR